MRSDSKKYLRQISIITSAEAEDAVGELMMRVLGSAAALYFNEETKISTVSVYCSQVHDWDAQKRKALQDGLRDIRTSGLNPGPGKIQVRTVPKEDWSESWKRHFKPIKIGSKLMILPSWIKKRPANGVKIVALDPGLSFGTGNHPTTAFCLHELVNGRDPLKRQTMLDIGTGSGILAIAAVKLGYQPVKAMDYDPEAVRIARENAKKNHVTDKLHPARQDITRVSEKPTHPYDLVCANLISNLLIAERRRIADRVRIGGRLVLAGILRTEFKEVQKAYEQIGFKLIRAYEDGEWRSGSFFRVCP